MSDEIRNEQLQYTADQYVSLVRLPVYVQFMRGTILWSFIPLLYILNGLRVREPSGPDQTGGYTPWGLPIDGITDDGLLMTFLVLNLFYGIYFAFICFKAIVRANPLRMFWKIFRYGKKKADTPTVNTSTDDSGAIIRLRITPDGEFPSSSVLAKDDRVRNSHEVGEFMLRRTGFGFVEHFLGKMVFPLALWAWALSCLVCEIWF